MASKVIKMCELPIEIAEKVFEAINGGKVRIVDNKFWGHVLVTNYKPEDLIYPEGWYYENGTFRNNVSCSSGIYQKTIMVSSCDDQWFKNDQHFPYCICE